MIKIKKIDEIDLKQKYNETQDDRLTKDVANIIADVRENGDKALRDYTARFDGVAIDTFKVSDREIDEAIHSVKKGFLSILERAADNIRKFHEKQIKDDLIVFEESGKILGQKYTPIEKVGLYVPGGTAVYPSTVLMTAIPAKIAGCDYFDRFSARQRRKNLADHLSRGKISGLIGSIKSAELKRSLRSHTVRKASKGFTNRRQVTVTSPRRKGKFQAWQAST